MAAWKKGKRHESWASNPNISVYIFCALFCFWVAFQIWAGEGGPQSPDILDKMVMTSLGVAITTKSVESGRKQKDLENQQDESKDRIAALEDVASEAHPKIAAEHSPPIKKDGDK